MILSQYFVTFWYEYTDIWFYIPSDGNMFDYPLPGCEFKSGLGVLFLTSARNLNMIFE